MYEAPVSNVLVGLADVSSASTTSAAPTTTEEEELMIFPCL